MENKIHENLLKNTEEIRQLISLFPTEAIVYACANDSLFRSLQNETSKKTNLSWKQRFFLLGLMLTTPEPKESKDLKNDDWEKSG